MVLFYIDEDLIFGTRDRMIYNNSKKKIKIKNAITLDGRYKDIKVSFESLNSKLL